MPLRLLARSLSCTLRPVSAGEQPVRGVASHGGADLTTVVFAEDARTLQSALLSSAGAILTTAALAETVPENRPVLLTDQPKLAFARAARVLRPALSQPDIHPLASVAPGTTIGDIVSIGPFAVVEDGVVLGPGVQIGAGAVIGRGCDLGAGCVVYPRVVLYPGVTLGRRVVVHAGAVLGSDGFGYVRDRATGAYEQFPQQGTLLIEDDVEIGANTTIDRGALEQTRIRRGVKLDNLVHVGHNVEVGEDVVIAAQTGISGSSTLGKGAVVAGQVGIADHVTIGEGAILGAQCGIPSNKQLNGPGMLFWGTPARPIQQYLKELATLARLTRRTRTKQPTGREAGE
ncbi:UDP-3-O-(3-hydroxymyristoyl)glucosamine N-acyltransferase [Acidipila sp. EB88]|nr:UDP-3-O-(3-hydroxymyristoyl)glucosamine N-acyltransferase [Acidipila sp. EB88]